MQQGPEWAETGAVIIKDLGAELAAEHAREVDYFESS